jgi:hypothetical protein
MMGLRRAGAARAVMRVWRFRLTYPELFLRGRRQSAGREVTQFLGKLVEARPGVIAVYIQDEG